MTEDDECYHWLEKTAGRDFTFGQANSLINNLKKDMSFRGRPDVWQYKLAAIRRCGKAIGEGFKEGWLEAATLVPVPPSKARDDDGYDDRMLQVLRAIPSASPLDIRELVVQSSSMDASHKSGGNRTSVRDLVRAYQIDEALTEPKPVSIGVVDDVLTVGRHFRAMKQVLNTRFPGVEVVGIFIARVVQPPPPPPPPSSDDFDF